jgi:hypothetical protein
VSEQPGASVADPGKSQEKMKRKVCSEKLSEWQIGKSSGEIDLEYEDWLRSVGASECL